MINGRKWWITGAMNPDAKVFIVMGKTDHGADRDPERHRRADPRVIPVPLFTKRYRLYPARLPGLSFEAVVRAALALWACALRL